MKSLRTQVAIVGAGPAGLMLSHLLHRRGIESIVLENKSRQYVEQRVRAGVLEQGSVDLLSRSGVGERMQREALVHHGIELRFLGGSHRIDLTQLSGGRSISVYGQQEVVKDLIRARLAAGGAIWFEVDAVRPLDFSTDRPRIDFVHDGEKAELRCDFIAGCDGFHGVCRPAIPEGALTFFERTYPFAWLGILARAKPASEELIYAYNERGFALLSMRSPEVSRLYLQVPPDEDIERWPDERIWQELRQRLETVPGFRLAEGPVLEKSVTGLRSFVAEPMRHGRMFLAGDAAHIVPPTGAKGMNLALADVHVLSAALARYFESGRDDLLESYSATCLRRVWRAEHFSYSMTSMLHRAPDDDAFTQKLQLSQLQYVVSSKAAATSLAENYVGLPLEGLESV
jgi:p-hydroxybenzoate 3-monooxygenase